MILKSRHHFVIYPFFVWYSRFVTSKKFRKVHFAGTFVEKEQPVLLLSNHISWYDGFWAVCFNHRFLKRKFHFMMLEQQLRKHWFFNYAGGFSVRKGSRSLLESLQYATELLTDPRNVVLMFPQGLISSSHLQQLEFQKGIEKILRDAVNPVQVIFVANFTDYLSDKKSSLYMYFEEYEQKDYSLDSIQQAYNQFYAHCISDQSNLKE